MEFKTRDVNERPSIATRQPSSSTLNPLSTHGFRPNGTLPDPIVQREWDKARIREEIIASEIARRRALEAEVRRELMAEWDWEIEANVQSLSTHPHLPFRHHFNNPDRCRAEVCFNLFPPPPQPRLTPHSFMLPPHLTDVQKTSEAKRDRLIVLAKPDPNRVVGAKWKTPPPAGTGELPLPSIGSKVKQLECAVCKISATSEKGLVEHLGGKKHKANVARQIAQRRMETDYSNTSSNIVTSQKKLGQSDKNLEDKEEIKNELRIKRDEKVETFMKKISVDALEMKDGPPIAIDEVEVTPKLSKKKKYEFWCKICLVGTHSKVVMGSHKKGKKHIARLKELHKNNVAALATATEQAKIELCSDAKATDLVPTKQSE